MNLIKGFSLISVSIFHNKGTLLGSTRPNNPEGTHPKDTRPNNPEGTPDTRPNNPADTRPNNPADTRPNNPVDTRPNSMVGTHPNNTVGTLHKGIHRQEGMHLRATPLLNLVHITQGDTGVWAQCSPEVLPPPLPPMALHILWGMAVVAMAMGWVVAMAWPTLAMAMPMVAMDMLAMASSSRENMANLESIRVGSMEECMACMEEANTGSISDLYYLTSEIQKTSV